MNTDTVTERELSGDLAADLAAAAFTVSVFCSRKCWRLEGRSETCSSGPVWIATRCWMQFSSSRTLPGHS